LLSDDQLLQKCQDEGQKKEVSPEHPGILEQFCYHNGGFIWMMTNTTNDKAIMNDWKLEDYKACQIVGKNENVDHVKFMLQPGQRKIIKVAWTDEEITINWNSTFFIGQVQ